MEEIKFPIYKKGIYSGTVVRFDSMNSGEVVEDSPLFVYPKGYYSKKWNSCLDTERWKDIEWDEESKTEIKHSIIEAPIETFINNFEQYGFKGNFSGEILKEFDDKLVGFVKENGVFYAMEWHKKGNNPAEAFYANFAYSSQYSLTPIIKEWYDEDYWIFVKDRGAEGHPNNPQKKFKFAWTEGMCKNLRESGWRLASDEELELMVKHRNKE